MRHRYLCDTVKFLLACLGFAVFVGLSCGCLLNGRMLNCLIFAALAAVYGRLAVQNASVIAIDENRVEKRIFGKTVLSFPWNEIQDVGLINSRFLYFSRDKMTEEDRDAMCFAWPPKDKIWFRAGRKASASVELLWNRREKAVSQYRSRWCR